MGEKIILYLPAGIENSAGGIGLVSVPCRLRLNISLAINLKLSKSKIWNLWEKRYFLLIFFPPRPIRLIVLLVNSLLFKTI